MDQLSPEEQDKRRAQNRKQHDPKTKRKTAEANMLEEGNLTAEEKKALIDKMAREKALNRGYKKKHNILHKDSIK